MLGINVQITRLHSGLLVACPTTTLPNAGRTRGLIQSLSWKTTVMMLYTLRATCEAPVMSAGQARAPRLLLGLHLAPLRRVDVGPLLVGNCCGRVAPTCCARLTLFLTCRAPSGPFQACQPLSSVQHRLHVGPVSV